MPSVQGLELHSAAEAGWRRFLQLTGSKQYLRFCAHPPGCRVDRGLTGGPGWKQEGV